MTHQEYLRRTTWLRTVLADAIERGDYHLEMDVKEQLQNLSDQFNSDE